jgi:hypothetical protein
MHIYYHIPQLVQKTPLSPAGNPWSLEPNRALARDYGKGACPASDRLFERALILTVPSALTLDQEEYMASAIRDAATGG